MDRRISSETDEADQVASFATSSHGEHGRESMLELAALGSRTLSSNAKKMVKIQCFAL